MAITISCTDYDELWKGCNPALEFVIDGTDRKINRPTLLFPISLVHDRYLLIVKAWNMQPEKLRSVANLKKSRFSNLSC